jgi:hypothetical protein
MADAEELNGSAPELAHEVPAEAVADGDPSLQEADGAAGTKRKLEDEEAPVDEEEPLKKRAAMSAPDENGVRRGPSLSTTAMLLQLKCIGSDR